MHDSSVLVVYREQASGRRALAAAAALEAPLTVVALAPKEVRSARCGIYTPALDLAVHAAAERELDTARQLLGARARSAEFVVLETKRDQDLAAWAVGAGFTTALIGARRTLLGVGPRDLAARALSRAGLEVRNIE
jgi:hypothetical protein